MKACLGGVNNLSVENSSDLAMGTVPEHTACNSYVAVQKLCEANYIQNSKGS